MIPRMILVWDCSGCPKLDGEFGNWRCMDDDHRFTKLAEGFADCPLSEYLPVEVT